MTEGNERLVDGWLPQIKYLNDLVECHRDATGFLRTCVNSETTQFQHIVVASHGAAAIYLKDSLSLIQGASLVSSLVLLRPVVEILLEMQYLKGFPNELKSYFGKVYRHNRQRAGGRTFSAPEDTLRFKTIESIVKTLHARGKHTPDPFENRLIERWRSLADAGAHLAPEVLTVGEGRREEEWRNTLGQLEQMAFDAIRQLFEIDEGLGIFIDQQQVLRTKVLHLSSFGATFSFGPN